MTYSKLEDREITAIHECIIASAYGPFFIDNNSKDNPYWEVHLIFGLSIEELRAIADKLPNVDLESNKSKAAINGCFNNLLGYPHKCSDKTWSKYISLPKEELADIYEMWKTKRNLLK